MTRFVVTACLLLLATVARAEDFDPSRIGVGFHGTRAPLGVRWWYTSDAALDLNVGFVSQVDFARLRLNQYVVQAGFPFELHRWDRLSALLRPGFEYALEEQDDFYLSAPHKVTDHVIQAAVELEAEAFLLRQLSISGSVGVAMAHRDYGGSNESQTSWAITGRNFTDIGFHLYFGGPR